MAKRLCASSRKRRKARQKERGSVEIKLKRHLVIEFRLIKGMGDNFSVITIIVWLCQQDEGLSCRVNSKGTAIAAAACIRSSRQWVHCITVLPVWTQSIGKSRKWLHHIALSRMECLLLGRSQRGIEVGVDISRPESESVKIRQLRSSDRKCVNSPCWTRLFGPYMYLFVNASAGSLVTAATAKPARAETTPGRQLGGHRHIHRYLLNRHVV